MRSASTGRDAGTDCNLGRVRAQGPARGRTRSPELLRNKYMLRKLAMDKGREARGFRPSARPSGSFPAWKLGRGSERFRAQ